MPEWISACSEVTIGLLTSDEISVQPLQIISSNPMNEREQAVEVFEQLVSVWQGSLNPFPGGRLVLDIRVGGINGENALSSGDTVRSSLIAIMQIDAKDLCEAMADLA
jgi:hypothetical protein